MRSFANCLQKQHVKLMPQMKEILDRALKSASDILEFSVYMYTLSNGILHYLQSI